MPNYLSTKTNQTNGYNDEDKYQNFDNNILTSIENKNSLKLCEPISRTTSEKFHCHNGNLKENDNNNKIVGNDSNQKTNTNSNQQAIRILWISVFICLIFMICEVIGGIWAQSLAIITDAAHLVN